MKKLLCAALCSAALLSTLPLSASAATGEQTTIEQVVNALGIIAGDASGELNLSAKVTRAEFTKMLVCASTLKDSVAPTGNSSPFQDVPYTHWASNYIKTAVSQGWITGYLDGTYRPDNPVTIAEAATAALKLLGYESTDFSGTYPYGQMALYQSLGLSDGISGNENTIMTRGDCVRLFYNLLSADIKDGAQTYMEKLGHKVDANGDPDYNDLLQETMDGPVVMKNSVQDAVGFLPRVVYRNGAISSVQELQQYDVLYYSASRSTVWAYSRRITGIYESVSPNKTNPTSITVAGKSYNVSGSTATAQLGSDGGLAIGSNITVLLGKDGDVVAAFAADELTYDLVGLVTAVSKEEYTNADGSSYTARTLSVLAADGQTYQAQANKTFSSGDLVTVTQGASGLTVSRLTKTTLSGKVTSVGIGNRQFASDVKILDIVGTTGQQVYPARLAGMTLQSSDVYYYALNAQGQIETLLLNDATGDCYRYGLATTASVNQGENDFQSSYVFLIDGQNNSVSLNGSKLNISIGPVQLLMNGSNVTSARQLKEIKNITSITDIAVRTSEESHAIWDRAQVYVSSNGTYTQMELSALNQEDYSIRAYYDKDDVEGGRVRLFVAIPKQ